MAEIEKYHLLSRKLLAIKFPSIVPDPPGSTDYKAPNVKITAPSIVDGRSYHQVVAAIEVPKFPPFKDFAHKEASKPKKTAVGILNGTYDPVALREASKPKKTAVGILNGTYDPVGVRKRADSFYHPEECDERGNKRTVGARKRAASFFHFDESDGCGKKKACHRSA